MKYPTFILCLLATAVQSAERPDEEILKKLEGTYRVTAVAGYGVTPETLAEIEFARFEGDKFTTRLISDGERKTSVSSFVVNTKQKPYQIDLKSLDRAVPKDQKSALGIVTTDGAITKMCVSLTDERPTAFEAGPNDRARLFTMKKWKPRELEENAKILKRLAGNYSVTAIEGLAPDCLQQCKGMIISGDTLSVVTNERDKSVYAITIDSTEQPCHINLKKIKGANREDFLHGIVTIDDRQVRISVADVSKNRPADFKPNASDESFTLSLKRDGSK